MMLRNLLGARLENALAAERGTDAALAVVDAFEIEALELDLLNVSLQSMRTENPALRSSACVLRMRALERVKETVAVAPADKWSIARLAGIANLSPCHLLG